jgi:hypothetical protein
MKRPLISPIWTTLIILQTTVIAGAAKTQSCAYDWGYEDTSTQGASTSPSNSATKSGASINKKKVSPSTKGQSATAKSTNQSAVHAGNPFARSSAKPKEDPSTQTTDSWLQLYSLVSSQPLTNDLINEIKTDLGKKLKTDKKAQVMQISKFWPQVQKNIADQPDAKSLFATLFRALLRLQLGSNTTDAEDKNILSQVLGPVRIAVPGDPPLTEEAVDAYNDMACFLYEQKNPGKTIDAIDNRTIFASVIAKKFDEAPNHLAKTAMANFALTWSKFKLVWANANDATRNSLLAQFQGTSSGAKVAIADPFTETILHNGPWSQLLYGK